jgi:hypothetical protein
MDHDRGSGPSQLQGDFLADATVGSGDQADLSTHDDCFRW